MKELDNVARMLAFNEFIAKAKAFGWEGWKDTAMLWSAWKTEVWPLITKKG